MSAAESQVRRLEAERNRLQAELESLEKSKTTAQACKSMIEYVQSRPEPLAADLQKENPWLANDISSGGCCTVM